MKKLMAALLRDRNRSLKIEFCLFHYLYRSIISIVCFSNSGNKV